MAEWWTEFFDTDYLSIYRRRDRRSAAPETAFVRRVLRLRRGQSVLDVCCGYGRHALLFARAGLKVTGVDINPLFLRRARAAARREGLKVDFVHSDVREMEIGPTFDAAVNLFTSIGYFESEEDNFQVVVRAAAALKPGGRLLLDTINRDHIVRSPQWRQWMPMGRGVVVETPAFDWNRGRLNSRRIMVFPDGRRRETRFSLRLYTLAELVVMFERAGLDVTHAFGDFAGGKYTVDSPRIVIAGCRPKPRKRAHIAGTVRAKPGKN
jgi:SAM-dependent methyltransferase